MGKITVSQLGKAYKQYPTRWSRLREWLTPGKNIYHQNKWILQDINFNVQPGEAVGIIGINGAGKSTLLKLITGTAQPTTGSVQMTGRVGAMLELGMGFHPDFTGRQNVLMAGQLLGMTGEEIVCLMPEIEAFAEIDEYIDQPVRVYSSGMQVRLAFSVATAIRPDILIIDEALSVGDAYFQHKSFDRIREFCRQGTTLLLVSHDKQAIQSICDRALLLNGGHLAMEGEPEAVMDYYNAMLAQGQENNSIRIQGAGSVIESGNSEATIERVEVRSVSGEILETACVGQLIEVHVVVAVSTDLPSLVLGCGFKDKYGQMVFGTNSYHVGGEVKNCKAGDRITYIIKCAANLGVGSYSVNISAHAGNSHLIANYHWIDRASVLQVVNCNKYEFVGTCWNPMSFSIKQLRNSELSELFSNETRGALALADVKYGSMLVYRSDMVIGKSLIDNGEFQESKISEVKKFIEESYSDCLDVFIDIGANIGTHSVYAIKEAGFKSVTSFEPDLNNYNLLVANLSLNGVLRVSKNNLMALSNVVGLIEMELSPSNYGDHRIKAKSTDISFGEEFEREYVSVPVTTLDEYVRQQSCDWSNALVWMDTQGHEGYVLEGGSGFIKSKFGPRYIVAEFWPYGIKRANAYEKFFEFINRAEDVYDLSRSENGRFLKVEAAHLAELYLDMLKQTEKEMHPHTDLLLVFKK